VTDVTAFSCPNMTSSLRNSIHRRNHKERSQPAHRTRLGFLEKHKDYVKRARDYHSKQDRLRRLRQKAAERNKDEFYFGMVKEKTQASPTIPHCHLVLRRGCLRMVCIPKTEETLRYQ
jgi:transcription initiation factor TFIID subunit TAF12